MENSFVCPLCCNESFETLEELRSHIVDIQSRLNCPLCNENFNEIASLASHLENCRAEAAPLYCEICDVRFDDIKTHLSEYHEGEEVILESKNVECQSAGEPDSKPQMEEIIIEQEILDDSEIVSPKKFIKIDVLPNVQRKAIVETIDRNSETSAIQKISQTVYRCPDCDLRFITATSFEKHDCGTIFGKGCHICSIYCSTPGVLNWHLKKYHADRTEITKCDICSIDFPSKKSLVLHRKMHDRVVETRAVGPPVNYDNVGDETVDETEHKFVCEVCEKEYNVKYREAHMKSHSSTLLTCTTCNKEFTDNNHLVMHMQAHVVSSAYAKLTCLSCKKGFESQSDLDEHSVNCEVKRYPCSYCGRRFSRAHEKIKHERIHTGHKPHVCGVCGKAFRVSYCLTLHMRSHSGVRPYKCELCDKRFKLNSSYVQHMQMHSDEKPYGCVHCPRSFKTSVQLAAHRNTHTKPFACFICNRPFASLYALRKHTASHNTVNNFDRQCRICGAVYARNFALRDHLMTHPEHTEEDLKQAMAKSGTRQMS